jgi:hypothetical protein
VLLEEEGHLLHEPSSQETPRALLLMVLLMVVERAPPQLLLLTWPKEQQRAQRSMKKSAHRESRVLVSFCPSPVAQAGRREENGLSYLRKYLNSHLRAKCGSGSSLYFYFVGCVKKKLGSAYAYAA